MLVVDFNSRMVHLLELRGQLEIEQQRLEDLKAEEFMLQQSIAYAASDEAIAEWAREQNWMGMEGDTVIVPIPDGSYQAEQESHTAEPQEFTSNWDAWLMWLTFDE
jgi:galactose-1-phosphate uridylyltransferase